MRNVAIPAVDDAAMFDSIARAKQQPRRGYLQAVRQVVMNSYQSYSQLTPNLANFPLVQITAEQKEALHHSYQVPTVAMSRLREAIFDPVDSVRCPLCGLSESSTLDHYLPKEVHAELSIFSKNLVPSCGQCNTRKNKLIVESGTGARLFLHPYYDGLPNQRFLRVETELTADALKLRFFISQPAGMSVEMFDHLRSHFRLLNLGNRYRRMSLDHLRGRHPALLRFYGQAQDANRVKVEMEHEAQDYSDVFGQNDWRAVLFQELSNDPVFCDGGFSVLTRVQ